MTTVKYQSLSGRLKELVDAKLSAEDAIRRAPPRPGSIEREVVVADPIKKKASGPIAKRVPAGRMTKAELAFGNYAKRHIAAGLLTDYQAHMTSLRFADNGARYNPDAVIVGRAAPPGRQHKLTFVVHVEVKGGYRGPGWEQGYERFRRAVAAWPWLYFILAEYKAGQGITLTGYHGREVFGPSDDLANVFMQFAAAATRDERETENE